MSGVNPCEPGVGEMSVLAFALNMVGGVREGEKMVATRTTGGLVVLMLR